MFYHTIKAANPVLEENITQLRETVRSILVEVKKRGTAPFDITRKNSTTLIHRLSEFPPIRLPRLKTNFQRMSSKNLISLFPK